MEAIAKRLNMEKAELDHLNPDFEKMMSGPENSYDLRVPKDKMKQFQAEKEEIIKESVQMTMDDKASGVDKSKFPPPVKLAAPTELRGKNTTTATSTKRSVKHKSAVKSKPSAKKKARAKKTTAPKRNALN